jgi:ubiquitin thioesterase OTU1
MPLMLLLRSYTDTATFALRCGQCRTPLKGEKDATKHAKETGHTQFVEYDA